MRKTVWTQELHEAAFALGAGCIAIGGRGGMVESGSRGEEVNRELEFLDNNLEINF